MIRGAGYLPADNFFPFSGLNKFSPEGQLAPGEAVSAINFTTFRGSLVKRGGYALTNFAASTVFRLINFQLGDGRSKLLAISKTLVYSGLYPDSLWEIWAYDGSTWTNVTTKATVLTFSTYGLGPNGWLVSGTLTPGMYVKQVSSNAVGWIADAPLSAAPLPAGSGAIIYPIQGTFNSTNNIVVTPQSVAKFGYSGTLALSGTSAFSTTANTTVYQTVTENDYVDFAVGTDENLGRVVVITNGKDPPIYWDGVTATFNILPVDLTDFCSAKAVGVFNSYLVFANILTVDSIEPQTAVWSDTGDFTNWTTGNSGVLAGLSFDGEILRLIPFGGNLVTISRNSIGCLCYINSDIIFGSQIYVTGIKVVGPRAVVVAPPHMIFAGQDNIYLWDGNRSVTAIGDKIAPYYQTLRSESVISRTQLFYDQANNQIRFLIPTGNTTNTTLMAEAPFSAQSLYEEDKSARVKWFEFQYQDRPLCFENWTDTSSASAITKVAVGSVGGNVYFEHGETNDNATAISATWETGDFVVPAVYKSQLARWLEIEFEAKGTSVVVSYSIDNGATWVSTGTTTLTSTLATYKLNIDVTNRFIRLRFVQATSSGTFTLSWYRLWFRPGGAR